MAGTVRKIIERIKDQRSGGNSVVALTVETRLVLQGFDPQRFEYDTPDDAGRLARIRDIAAEMNVDVDDLVATADVEPDPDVAPAPPPGSPLGGSEGGLAASAAATAAAAGVGPAARSRAAMTDVDSNHPLRKIKEIAARALAEVGDDVEAGPRSGVPFGTLLRASLLMALYSIASDRVFCDQLRYNTLFRWFMDLDAEAGEPDPDAFAEDREQALAAAPARAFFDQVVLQASKQRLFSSGLFQVNGRQIKGWMSQRAGV